MNILYVFPGQGSQYEGMGKDICEAYDTARRIYDAASEVLGYDIADMSFNNPNDELNLTRNTQPALLTHHIACLEVFREKTGGRRWRRGTAWENTRPSWPPTRSPSRRRSGLCKSVAN